MTYRVTFDTLAGAVEGLLVVLEDARQSEFDYSFGPLSATQVYLSGLLIVGQVDEVGRKLDKIEGASRTPE